MITNQFIINENSLCDDWGWYVDIENYDNYNKNKISYLTKCNLEENDLDEYDYYTKLYNNRIKSVKSKKYSYSDLFLKYSSQTIFTASLGYIAFLVLFKQWYYH